MANELYYDYITEELHAFKLAIDESKIEILPQIADRTGLSPQSELIRYIDEIIQDSDIEKFSENMNYYLQIREEVLKNYTEKRIKQILDLNPKLIHERYLVVGSKKKSTGEVFEKRIKSNSYNKESVISHLIREHKDNLLPENTDLSDIDINFAVNLSAFYDMDKVPRSKRLAITLDKSATSLDDPESYLKNAEYIIASREKKSFRELEKFVDYLLGVREEFHYDSIATHEICPKILLHNNVEKIHALSDSKPFKADYRPNNILLPFYNKDNINEIVSNGKKIIEKVTAAKREVSAEEKEQLLAGVWVDHHYSKMRVETILQMPEFFDWFRGILGHDSYYYSTRKTLREKSHKNLKFQLHRGKSDAENIIIHYDINQVAKHLENRFKKIYDLDILSESQK
ncbi:MAG: hypothetical protein ACP5NV_05290 [Candidatus Woesearchaeota archaeon]